MCGPTVQQWLVCHQVRTQKRPVDRLGIQAIDFGFPPTSKDRIATSFGRGFDSHRPLHSSTLEAEAVAPVDKSARIEESPGT